jgi:hypothetical protein
MSYLPLSLKVEGNVVTLKIGCDTLSRDYGDPNTAAQRFGEVRECALTLLKGGMG